MGYSNVLPAWLFLPNNKGKKMTTGFDKPFNPEAIKASIQKAQANEIKYDEQGNPIVPVNSSATMEFQTETVKNEG